MIEKGNFLIKVAIVRNGTAELRVCFFPISPQELKDSEAIRPFVFKDLLCVEFEMFPIAIMSL